jgi:DNA processing protein
LVGLLALPSIGPQRMRSILAAHSPSEAFQRLANGRPLAREVEEGDHRKLFDRLRDQARTVVPSQLLDTCAALGVSVVTYDDPQFPAILTVDPVPPPALFVLGGLDVLESRRVGIIGTRNATAAGRATAWELGEALAVNGVAVVSGLARGIDGAAHRGVRIGAGKAIGVVANGLDRPYPKQNTDIWRWVAGNGLLLSEWPPGTLAEAWRFPLRNRIIAALSEVLVVVESRISGGSLITAGAALDRGVDVMAVPGSPRNVASAGTNKLLADGAAVVTCVDDVLMALGIDHSRHAGPPLLTSPVDVASADVLALCEQQPCTLDMIASLLRVSVTDAAIAVSRLETMGLVVDSGGWFESARSLLRGSKVAGP